MNYIICYICNDINSHLTFNLHNLFQNGHMYKKDTLLDIVAKSADIRLIPPAACRSMEAPEIRANTTRIFMYVMTKVMLPKIVGQKELAGLN